MKTAVIYARYTSDSQTEQSIDGQLRVCEEYAKKNNITILEGIYTTRATIRKGIQYSKFSNLFAEEAIFVISRD